MEYSVRLADLQALSPTAQDSALRELTKVALAPVNGQAVTVDARISAFESRYEMSSEELVRRLKDHEVEETADYVSWLFWIRLRDSGVSR